MPMMTDPDMDMISDNLASAADATVGGLVGAVTSPATGLTGSIVEWLTKACNQLGGSEIVSCYYVGGLAILLFVHYIFYILENLSAFQFKAQNWKQALSEVRQFLQVGVIRWMIYFGAFLGGLAQGLSPSQEVTQEDLQWGLSWGTLVVVILLINKACVLLTGIKNLGNDTSSFSSIGYGPLGYENVSVGGSATGLPILNNPGAFVSAPVRPSNKPWWVYLTWIQTVTDILLANMFYPAALGYAGGKFAIALRT